MKIATITFDKLENFINTAKKYHTEQVYYTTTRCHNQQYTTAKMYFTAWCPEVAPAPLELVYPHTIPEIKDLGRGIAEFGNVPWDTCFDVTQNAHVSCYNQKKNFLLVLERLGADEAELKKYKAVTVTSLEKLIDASDAENDEFTVSRSKERQVITIPLNWQGVTEARFRIRKEGGRLQYHLCIEHWDSVLLRLISPVLKQLADCGLEPVPALFKIV